MSSYKTSIYGNKKHAKQMLKFSPDYLIAINCQDLDDDRINHHYCKSVKNFSLEPFDFGSNIIYLERLDDPEELRTLLIELSAPGYKICHTLSITLNTACILEKSKENSGKFEEDSIWIKSLNAVVSEFNNMEILYTAHE
jgi:hypothetical protein